MPLECGRTVSGLVSSMLLSRSYALLRPQSCIVPIVPKRFTHVRHIPNLLTRSLCSLLVGSSLESLSLTGTGSDREYAVLAQLPALRCLHLRGPIVMTSERLCMLGIDIELQILKLDQLSFPCVLYESHALETAAFPCLQTLELPSRHSLTRNGTQSTWQGASFWVLSSR